MTDLNHMTAAQAATFLRVARLHNVAILVRQTNLRSLPHIGTGYAVAKPIDCKAKTADFDVEIPGAGRKRIAGLVTDPTIVGPEAYSKGKYEEAREKWDDFARSMLSPKMATLSEQRTYTYVPDGGQYFVERDPASPHYGCVRFASSSLIAAGKVIHGDFDLYAIVDMDAPSVNRRVSETLRGQPHTRGPKFRDVQIALNRGFNVPLVLHGSQETYRDHTDEPVDAFFPDGTVKTLRNRAAVLQLYRSRFGGRQAFAGEARPTGHGRWEIPG